MEEKKNKSKVVAPVSTGHNPPEDTRSLGPSIRFHPLSNTKSGEVQTPVDLSNGTPLSKESAKQFAMAFKEATGTEDFSYGPAILSQISRGLCYDTSEQRLTHMASLLPTMRPQDETEALLAGQFLALQHSGMEFLRRVHIQDSFYHVERYTQLATKLFNMANQTMQALLKYRVKGQQTVQVIHMHNEGQAIVAQNVSSGGVGG